MVDSSHLKDLVKQGKELDREVDEVNPNLKRKPFEAQHLDHRKVTMSIRLNIDEWTDLKLAKQLLQQPKDSTAYKQLARIGLSFVLQDQKIREILDIALNNKRKNQRSGTEVFE